MKRNNRIHVLVFPEEVQELEQRAKRANMAFRRYIREFLLRRVRNRLDASIFDEIQRVRIELNRHGGLLAQMRNRLLEQRVSRDMKNEIADIFEHHLEACAAVHELKSRLETKLNRDDETEVAEDDHKENPAH